MSDKKTPKSWIKATLKYFLCIGLPILVAIGLFWPLPYYIESPGTTEPINQIVQVAGKTDTAKGHFYLTTVKLQQANLMVLGLAKIDSQASVIPQKEISGGLSDADYDRINQYYMETSQNLAIYQAFKEANLPYQVNYEGVYVMNIASNSSFSGKLQLADTVTGVDDKEFSNSQDLINYIQQQKVGDAVKINVTRLNASNNKEKLTFDGKYIKLPNGKAGIGINLTDHTEVKSTPSVKISTEGIGGPSAGLMFTLETYQTLTNIDLRQGREIAGTGEIGADGNIGQIGGIDKKVATASAAGASIFLAPDNGQNVENNYKEALDAAKKLHTSMKIVPVKNFKEALDYLKK